jgi:hypothetical protein
MTCAICLERTPLVEIALVKGCEHQYCGEHRATARLGTKHMPVQQAPRSPAPCCISPPDHSAGAAAVLVPCAVNCILQWSLCKEWCPQCKHPFDYLLTHKQLDGTVTDFLTEESVVLLKRARWFEEYMRVRTSTTPHGQHHSLRQRIPVCLLCWQLSQCLATGVVEQLGLACGSPPAVHSIAPALNPTGSPCLRPLPVSHVSLNRPRRRARPPWR